MPKTAEYPEKKVIDGQQAICIDCPLQNWPGCIYVPRSLDEIQFATWWEKYQASGGDKRGDLTHTNAIKRLYQERYHIILEAHIDGLDGFGEELRELALMNFVAAATQPLILEARYLPNLPGWWSATTSGDSKRPKNEKK